MERFKDMPYYSEKGIRVAFLSVANMNIHSIAVWGRSMPFDPFDTMED
jgi:hypothetical protein